jgi:diguanylate cyclase (GGDEF)-like protein
VLEQPIYDTTVTDSFFSLEQTESSLSQHEINLFMHQLMSSIDLHKLTSLFYQQLKNKLNLRAVKIKHHLGILTLGDADSSCNVKTIEYTHEHQSFATISYFFTGALSVRETSILQELHRHFKSPLCNALEFQKVKQMAMKDHLTSLGNRANYQETLHRLISNAKRHESAFGLLVIDMDKFKQVNDRYGHHEGDNVLVAMAEVLQQSLRDTDYAFRFGGDEFCCLLQRSNGFDNERVANRIQASMRKHPTLAKHAISCSIGSANYHLEDTEQSLFSRADQALYGAKNAGRSCFQAA